MAKGTIGVTAALLVWLGAATAAEAQGIDVTITGPSAIYSDQDEMTVTGTVSNYPTPPATYYFWVRVKVNGVYKHLGVTNTASGASFSYPLSGMQTWPISTGNSVEIICKVWTSSTNYKVSSKFITVAQGGGTYAPADLRRFGAPALREESYAWLSRKDLGVSA